MRRSPDCNLPDFKYSAHQVILPKRWSVQVLAVEDPTADRPVSPQTFPALFGLFKDGFLPPKTHIVGYARSALETKDFEDRLTGGLDMDKEVCGGCVSRV